MLSFFLLNYLNHQQKLLSNRIKQQDKDRPDEQQEKLLE